jgi:hypothetical protein
MGCGALERGRLAWIVLEKLDLLKPGVRLLNCAPEPFMLRYGAERLGKGYLPTDYDPSLFAKWKVPIMQLDLCNPQGLELASVQCIMHNHVLEHVPCSVVAVLRGLNRFISPGGYHLFSTPIMPGRATVEDLSPDLTPEEKLRRFGQDDHVRMFGSLDFASFIEGAGMLSGLVDLSALISEDELRHAGLDPNVFATYNSHRVFAWRQASVP